MDDIFKEMNCKNVEAWVVYDYCCTNPIFNLLVGNYHLTRKCFLVISVTGKKQILCHTIDLGVLVQNGLDRKYEIIGYSTWGEMISCLKEIIPMNSRVMMEISENGLMPRVSNVDYGTAKLIESLGCELISSADLAQILISRMDSKSYELHLRAGEVVTRIKDRAFEYMFGKIVSEGEISEYEVQRFIMNQFMKEGMVTDSPAIVAIGKNAANPHYEPSENRSDTIRKGDVVLIDLWAKFDKDGAVFADITWMGYVGEEVPPEYQKLFDVLHEASDVAIKFISDNIGKRIVCGYEVDDVCRDVVERHGYGKYFTHRTGHSLSVGDSDHGNGVNIDNYETHDTRALIDGIGFSIEPGIYIDGKIGVREECNVCIWGGNVVVTTPRQSHILKPSHFGFNI